MPDSFFRPLPSLSTAPPSPVDGEAYYNTATAEIQFRENGVWAGLGAGGGAPSYSAPVNTFLSAADQAAMRTELELGTSALLDVGTTANKVLQLDGSARIPAVDGSLLTNLPSSGSAFIVVTSNYTAVAGDKILADSTTGRFTITLPASPVDGDAVTITPADGRFSNKNITVERNGGNIDGATANAVLTNTVGATLVYRTGYGWRSFAHANQRGRLSLVDATNNQYGVSLDAVSGFLDVSAIHLRYGTDTETLLARFFSAGDGLAVYGVEVHASSRFRAGSGNGVCWKYLATGVVRFTDYADAGIITEYGQVAAGGTPSADSARIYAKDVSGTAEMFAMDEAGNEVQLTNHNTTAPEWMHDGAGAKFSANYYTGIVRYQSHDTGEIYLESFADHNTRTGEKLEQLVWADVQAEHVAKSIETLAEWQKRKAKSIETLAEWQKRNNEFKPTEEAPAFTEPEPVIYEPKPEPAFIQQHINALADNLAKQDAALELKTQRSAMADTFDSLPLAVQAGFWSARVAIESALDKGRADVARAILEATPVPDSLAATKQALLDRIP